jgi:hypothetical protein
LLEHTAPDEVANLSVYYSRLRYKVATGMFGGPTRLMEWLVNDFSQNLIRCLNTGIPSLEEAIVNVSCFTNPELFDFYYGNYHGVCTNSPIYNRDYYQVKIAFLQCRDRMWMNGVKICRYMIKSIQHSQNNLQVIEEIQIMDELILTVWNAFKDKPEFSNLRYNATRMAGERIIHLFKVYPELLRPDLRSHYNNNICFLGLRLPE